MKKLFLSVVMLGVQQSIPVQAQSQQKPSDFPQTAEGQVLAKVMGVWQRAAGDRDATAISADRQINKWSLKNRWLEGHIRSGDGADSAMVMTTYDADRETYVGYLFTPAGLNSTPLGRFDADAQQMTWIDRSPKGPTTTLERLTDPDTLDVQGSMQNSDGKTIRQWSRRMTRINDNQTVAASSKQQALSQFQGTSEGKVLARYIGQWHSMLVFMGREKQIDYDTSWAIEGRWLYAKISSSDGRESLSMTTFDATQKAFVTWSFSSDGSVDAWKGSWDASAADMTWSRQSAKGGVVDVDHFVDEDTIEIATKKLDATGNTVVEAAEHVRRK